MRPNFLERVCLPLAPTGCQPEEAQAEEDEARRFRNAREPADLDTGLKVLDLFRAAGIVNASHLPINRKLIQGPSLNAVPSGAAIVAIETEGESADAYAGRQCCLKTYIKGVARGINQIHP